MPLLTNLLLLIVTARLMGQLFTKYRQPAIVGEMLAGVILGPALLGIISSSPALSGISDLAVFLVVLSAGLEMNFRDVVSAMQGKGLIIALISFAVPLFSGIGVGLLFELDVIPTVFLGLCVSITALPVAIRMLESFGLLNTVIAKYSIASAIINDVIALLILGVILGLPEQGSFFAVAESVVFTGGKLLILAGIILSANRLLEIAQQTGFPVQRIPERLIHIFGSEALFGIVVVFVLVFGSFSEVLGFHFVIGAFFGALLISKELFLASRYAELERTIGSVTNGFLAPLFFAYLGLEFVPSEIQSVGFLVAVLIISIASKYFSGWLGGKIVGLSKAETRGLAVILNGRGVMELVIANIAYRQGIISQGLFSTLIIMGVFTTIVTPLMFRQIVEPHLDKKVQKKY